MTISEFCGVGCLSLVVACCRSPKSHSDPITWLTRRYGSHMAHMAITKQRPGNKKIRSLKFHSLFLRGCTLWQSRYGSHGNHMAHDSITWRPNHMAHMASQSSGSHGETPRSISNGDPKVMAIQNTYPCKNLVDSDNLLGRTEKAS